MPTYTDSNNTVVLSDFTRTVYSKEILLQAEPVMKWLQFARKQTELNVEPSHTIEMLRLGNLTTGVRLGEPGVTSGEATTINSNFSTKYGYNPGAIEESSIPMNKMSTSKVGIRVFEYGNGIEVSEMQLKSSFTETLAHGATLLGRDYAKVVDKAIRDEVFTRTTNRVYGGTKTLRSSIVAADTMGLEVLREVNEQLAVNKATPFVLGDMESYIAMVHPHHSRKLRSETSSGGFLEVTKYTTPEIAIKGEIGKIEKVRFVETTALPIIYGAGVGMDWSSNAHIGTNMVYLEGTYKTYTSVQYDAHVTALAPIYLDNELYGYTTHATWVDGAWSVTGSMVNVYQGCIFGDYSFALATSLPVELRDGGIMEMGRVHQIAWYSIFGAGTLNTDSIFIFETA